MTTLSILYGHMFDQSEQRSLGKIFVNSRFGEIEYLDKFLVIYVDAFLMLLSKLRVHKMLLSLRHTISVLNSHYGEDKKYLNHR